MIPQANGLRGRSLCFEAMLFLALFLSLFLVGRSRQ